MEGPAIGIDDVVLVNFGGTITMSGREGIRPVGRGLGARAHADALGPVLERMPLARPPDSTNVGPAEWAVLLDELLYIQARKEDAWREAQRRGEAHRVAGVVVTHGTDTMAYTSFVAALQLNSSLHFPVVFTGSYAPLDAANTDGWSNLRKALAVARDALVPGVYVLFGEDLHLPGRLVKVRTEPDLDGRYFHSFPGPIGRVQGIQPTELTLPEEAAALLQPGAQAPPWMGRFGYVEHLIVDVRTSPDVLERALRRFVDVGGGRRLGLVIQGNFARHPDFPRMVDGLASIAAVGALIFVGSREVAEAVWRQRPGPGVDLLAKCLLHATAWTKLSWLLGTTLDDDAVRRAMNASLAADVFTARELPQWTRYETFPPGGPRTAVVIGTPGLHHRQIEDAVAGLQAGGTLYLYGFGHGHIPTPNRSLRDIVCEDLGLDLPECPTLDDLVDAVADALCADAGLRDRVRESYEVVSGFASRLLREREAERTIQSLRRQLWARIRSIGDAWLQERDAEWGKGDRLGAFVMSQAPIRLTAAAQRRLGELERQRAAMSAAELFEVMLDAAPDLVARRLIRDAVGRSDPRLSAVADALERGHTVQARSLSVGARTDLTRYEVGNFLHVLGGDAADSRGWEFRHLRPRRPDAPSGDATPTCR